MTLDSWYAFGIFLMHIFEDMVNIFRFFFENDSIFGDTNPKCLENDKKFDMFRHSFWYVSNFSDFSDNPFINYNFLKNSQQIENSKLICWKLSQRLTKFWYFHDFIDTGCILRMYNWINRLFIEDFKTKSSYKHGSANLPFLKYMMLNSKEM